MKPDQFCYWLQGFFELSDEDTINEVQIDAIKRHLNLVFVHSLDPESESETSATKWDLQHAHDGNDVHNKETLYRC